MIAAILPLLTVLGQIASLTSQTSVIGDIIKTVAEVAPVIIKTVNDATPSVIGIINALKENPATTEEQLAELDAISAKVDADFEAAVAAQD
jgi:hypothetical protein